VVVVEELELTVVAVPLVLGGVRKSVTRLNQFIVLHKHIRDVIQVTSIPHKSDAADTTPVQIDAPICQFQYVVGV
jgi:hypothetical protein